MFLSKLNIVTRSAKDIQPNLIHKASICHKSKLPPKNVKHWPYKEKSWNPLNLWTDPFTKKKFDENTKVIQIEGNIASGKREFANQLAEELGMKVFPEISLDNLYINLTGYDYRALNPSLPERLKICDLEMFHENPARHSVVHMQYYLFKLRYYQYFEALRHLFNTGQGVILVRSCFTERVFVEAMHNMGWLPLGHERGDGVIFYDWKTLYEFLRNNTLGSTLRPHLTIYLDTPVDTCMDRIRNSKDPIVANSNALCPKFLEEIRNAYDQTILRAAEDYGYVLRVDHPAKKIRDEIIDVIDQIEPVDFNYDWHDTRYEGWELEGTHLWYFFRRLVFTNMYFLRKRFARLGFEWFDIAGLGDSITYEDLALRNLLYNANVGDFGVRHSYHRNPEIHSPLKVLFNRDGNFSEIIDRELRNDFR